MNRICGKYGSALAAASSGKEQDIFTFLVEMNFKIDTIHYGDGLAAIAGGHRDIINLLKQSETLSSCCWIEARSHPETGQKSGMSIDIQSFQYKYCRTVIYTDGELTGDCSRVQRKSCIILSRSLTQLGTFHFASLFFLCLLVSLALFRMKTSSRQHPSNEFQK